MILVNPGRTALPGLSLTLISGVCNLVFLQFPRLIGGTPHFSSDVNMTGDSPCWLAVGPLRWYASTLSLNSSLHYFPLDVVMKWVLQIDSESSMVLFLDNHGMLIARGGQLTRQPDKDSQPWPCQSLGNQLGRSLMWCAPDWTNLPGWPFRFAEADAGKQTAVNTGDWSDDLSTCKISDRFSPAASSLQAMGDVGNICLLAGE